MPRHAAHRPRRARRFSAGSAVVAGSFALACTATLGSAQAAQAAEATPAVASTGATTYVVQPGDHLAAIARSLDVPGGWEAIAAANHLASPYVIYPGQVLTLPDGSSTATKTGSATAAESASATAAKSGSSTSAKTASATAAKAGSSTVAKTATASTSKATYPDNLDGWIRHSLAVMATNGIPGTYNGIYRNVMRESSGNPKAINLWDSNAAKGTPSKGLLQVIDPTFTAYHVPGTSWDIYDPVANITAACNYAYHRYGSIDNVNGPY
ncbi:LysM peptidoglycan-binding domain-containing protein [Streptomyces sp. NRRL S-813]|uniref:LysM peptidoglycan-binding domain-containing protein n=1 Tax=Streptomyces sp. NRRL S-813 TaxID=1463919 RepID=UPI0004C04025|nr:LysM peptidoglycan-binding domain-containing protein [Streptomyces sp. NRRL S-813]